MNDIKLVCFDMDDTLINQNSWYKLNLALGVTPEEDKEMYAAYGSGSLSYSDWTESLISLYKQRGLATKTNITQALISYVFKEGAIELVNYLHHKGYEVVIISGSFDLLVSHVANALGVVHYKANTEFVLNSDDYLETLRSEGDEVHAKLRHLKGFCKELGIPLDQCACIGDGANDIELFKYTRKGITFKDAPDPVKATAWKVVDTLSDIKQLL
jgi:phosphoserine phosphatase